MWDLTKILLAADFTKRQNANFQDKHILSNADSWQRFSKVYTHKIALQSAPSDTTQQPHTMEYPDEYVNDLDREILNLLGDDEDDVQVLPDDDSNLHQTGVEGGRTNTANIIASAPFMMTQGQMATADASKSYIPSAAPRAMIIPQNNWKPSLVMQQERQNQQNMKKKKQQQQQWLSQHRSTDDQVVSDVTQYDAILGHTRRQHKVGQQVWYEVRGGRRKISDDEAGRLIEKFENDARLARSPIKPRILVGTKRNELGLYQCRIASLEDIRKSVNTKRDTKKKPPTVQQPKENDEVSSLEPSVTSTKTPPKKRKTSSSPQPPAVTPSSHGKDAISISSSSFVPIDDVPRGVTGAADTTNVPAATSSPGLAARPTNYNAGGDHNEGKTLRAVLSDYFAMSHQLEQEYYHHHKQQLQRTDYMNMMMVTTMMMDGGGGGATAASGAAVTTPASTSSNTIMYHLHIFRKTLDAFLSVPYTDQLPHTLMELSLLEGYHQIINTTRTLWTQLRNLCQTVTATAASLTTKKNNRKEDDDEENDGGDDNMDTSSSSPPPSPEKNGPGYGSGGEGRGVGGDGKCQAFAFGDKGAFWCLSAEKDATSGNETQAIDNEDSEEEEDAMGKEDSVVDLNLFCEVHDGVQEEERGLDPNVSKCDKPDSNMKSSSNDNDSDDDDEDGPTADGGGAAVMMATTNDDVVKSPPTKAKSEAAIRPSLSPWKKLSFDDHGSKKSLRATWIKTSTDNSVESIQKKSSSGSHTKSEVVEGLANLRDSTTRRQLREQARKQQPEPRRTPSLLGVNVSASATSYLLMCSKNSSTIKRVRSAGSIKARSEKRRYKDKRNSDILAGSTHSLISSIHSAGSTSDYSVSPSSLRAAEAYRLRLERKKELGQAEPTDKDLPDIGKHPQNHKNHCLLQRITDLSIGKAAQRRSSESATDEASVHPDLPPPPFCEASSAVDYGPKSATTTIPQTSTRPTWMIRAKFVATNNNNSECCQQDPCEEDSTTSTTRPASVTSLYSLKASTTTRLKQGVTRSEAVTAGRVDPSKTFYRLW